MENAEGHKVKYLVLYTTTEAASKVSDECMIIDTRHILHMLTGKQNATVQMICRTIW